MSAKQALVLAKGSAKTPLTNLDIVDRTGFGESEVKRYFGEHDAYYPSYHRIPMLCRALGNTVLFDWLKAQVEDLLPTDDPIDTPGEVAETACALSAQTGRVCSEAAEAMKDGKIDAKEARRLDAELAQLQEQIAIARGRLKPVADRKTR